MELPDAHGRVHTIEDKAPVLFGDEVDETESLPQNVWLVCDAEDLGDWVRTTLRHNVESVQGVKDFVVARASVR